MSKLLKAILYAIGFSLMSLALIPFVMGILWIFVFGDSTWPDIFGIDPIVFVVYSLPLFGAISGFIVGWKNL